MAEMQLAVRTRDQRVGPNTYVHRENTPTVKVVYFRGRGEDWWETKREAIADGYFGTLNQMVVPCRATDWAFMSSEHKDMLVRSKLNGIFPPGKDI